MKTYVLLGFLVLGGCATAPARYVKTGGTEEEMQRTLAKCRVQAAMTPGEGAWGALTAASVKKNCMRAEGWVREPD